MGDVAHQPEIIEQLQVLVSDLSHVVSYKWLSRKFSLSSNTAKRLLQEFVDKHGDGLETVYVVSGWTQMQPPSYSVQLVQKAKLQEAKARLTEKPSVHIYSVQGSLPKDPAHLWTADFVQAEELFNEAPEVNNCLRDNRFSGVSCSLVTRNLKGKISRVKPSCPVPVPKTEQPSSSKHVSQGMAPVQLDTKPLVDTGKDAVACKQLPPETKDTSVKNPAFGAKAASTTTGKQKQPSAPGQGSSLTNLWGRAPTTSKPNPPKLPDDCAQRPVPGNADANIQALEELANDASSDDDVANLARIRRGQPGKKRRVVFEDDADGEALEAEEIVSLVSPEIPDEKAGLVNDTSGEHGSPPAGELKSNEASTSDDELVHKETKSTVSGSWQKDEVVAGASSARIETIKKKRKVLRTRIDERGREVTEVVWDTEGLEDTTKEAAPTVKSEPQKPESNSGSSVARAPVAPPAPKPMPKAAATAKSANKSAGKGGKAGKAGGPQQGSITSFFKKK